VEQYNICPERRQPALSARIHGEFGDRWGALVQIAVHRGGYWTRIAQINWELFHDLTCLRQQLKLSEIQAIYWYKNTFCHFCKADYTVWGKIDSVK
jgi:hypothetical protein